MIRKERYQNALYALHGILIKARELAYENADSKILADLLDYAEILPRLIATPEDRTDEFRRYIDAIADEFGIEFIRQKYNSEINEAW